MVEKNLGNVRGPQGTSGEKGENGLPAKVEVGNVETLEPGQSVSISSTTDDTTNTSTFNFGIPKGQAGKSVDIQGGIYTEDTLPDFETTEVNKCFIVKDGDRQFDLYVRGEEAVSEENPWTIVEDWQGNPGNGIHVLLKPYKISDESMTIVPMAEAESAFSPYELLQNEDLIIDEYGRIGVLHFEDGDSDYTIEYKAADRNNLDCWSGLYFYQKPDYQYCPDPENAPDDLYDTTGQVCAFGYYKCYVPKELMTTTNANPEWGIEEGTEQKLWLGLSVCDRMYTALIPLEPEDDSIHFLPGVDFSTYETMCDYIKGYNINLDLFYTPEEDILAYFDLALMPDYEQNGEINYYHFTYFELWWNTYPYLVNIQIDNSYDLPGWYEIQGKPFNNIKNSEQYVTERQNADGSIYYSLNTRNVESGLQTTPRISYTGGSSTGFTPTANYDQMELSVNNNQIKPLWSNIQSKPFSRIDTNTLSVENDTLKAKIQAIAWEQLTNKPFSSIGTGLQVNNDILEVSPSSIEYSSINGVPFTSVQTGNGLNNNNGVLSVDPTYWSNVQGKPFENVDTNGLATITDNTFYVNKPSWSDVGNGIYYESFTIDGPIIEINENEQLTSTVSRRDISGVYGVFRILDEKTIVCYAYYIKLPTYLEFINNNTLEHINDIVKFSVQTLEFSITNVDVSSVYQGSRYTAFTIKLNEGQWLENLYERPDNGNYDSIRMRIEGESFLYELHFDQGHSQIGYNDIPKFNKVDISQFSISNERCLYLNGPSVIFKEFIPNPDSLVNINNKLLAPSWYIRVLIFGISSNNLSANLYVNNELADSKIIYSGFSGIVQEVTFNIIKGYKEVTSDYLTLYSNNTRLELTPTSIDGETKSFTIPQSVTKKPIATTLSLESGNDLAFYANTKYIKVREPERYWESSLLTVEFYSSFSDKYFMTTFYPNDDITLNAYTDYEIFKIIDPEQYLKDRNFTTNHTFASFLIFGGKVYVVNIYFTTSSVNLQIDEMVNIKQGSMVSLLILGSE